MTSDVRCLVCGIALTDPVSRARRHGPDHDPDPAARAALTVRLGRPRQWAQDGPNLLDNLDQLPDRHHRPGVVVEPADLLALLEAL